jgi:alcohol dehydrogenase (NADP+)
MDFSHQFKCTSFASVSASGPFEKTQITRRACANNDVVIEIKYAGICHSDIHTVRDEWGPQKYPLAPGHEIAGVVVAVGSHVKNFKVGDHAGVGCMVDSCGTCDECSMHEEQYCGAGKCIWTYGTKFLTEEYTGSEGHVT